MYNYLRPTQKWLSILIVVGGLLPALPAAAQSSVTGAPAEASATLALFIPFTATDNPAGQPAGNPLTVVPTLDSANAVTQTIAVEGGEMSVTATNGTKFTLTIPADALLSDEEIVMTPLSAVSAMPLSGGLVAGVQLGPEGLRLLEAATLKIEAAPGFEAGLQAAAFGYQGNGEEFHLRPLVQNENGFALKLNHFSGYGVTAGSAAEVQTQVTDHAPSAPDDQLAQSAVIKDVSLQDLTQWYDNIVKPALLAGRDGNDSKLSEGIIDLKALLMWAKEFGFEDELAPQIAEGWKHLLLGLANAVERSSAACRNGDASKVVKALRWARIIRMMPVEQRREWIADSYISGTMTQLVTKCATFEMDFDSTLAQDVPGVPSVGQAHDSHLRAEKIRVQFDLNGKLAAASQAPLIYNNFNLAGATPGCSNQTEKTNSTFNLMDGRINLNYGWDEHPKLSFKFDPGHPTETITHHCPENVDLISQPRFWNTGFWLIHWQELRIQAQHFDFKAWHFVGGTLYADLIITRPATEQTQYFSGTTWMVLAHTPQ